MEICDPLEHPAASVRRDNIMRLARRGGAHAVHPLPLSALILGAIRKVLGRCGTLTTGSTLHAPYVPGGEKELQQLAQMARTDSDGTCRAAAVCAMVAIR